MNIQIYVNKKNPDVLKAERFFKERRVLYQLVDLKKISWGSVSCNCSPVPPEALPRWWIAPG